MNKGPPTEATALLGSRHETQQHDDETPVHYSPWRILFDSHANPGFNSEHAYVRWPAHAWYVIKRTLLSSPVNILLPFVPVGIVAGMCEWSATTVFILNFAGIVPLAAILSFATEEISNKLGDTLGGLMNASFGNAVELIVSIIALKAGQIEVVQASMLGSILSNLLLVMGMCFFLGGIYNMRERDGRGREQVFQNATAQTTCSLMALSSASMIIPAALYSVMDQAGEPKKNEMMLILSRGTAIILLVLYAMYMFFQIRTHANLFNKPKEADPEAEVPNGESSTPALATKEEEDDELPEINPWAATAVLVIVTVIISVCADYLVAGIDPIVASGAVSKTFIGLILIPIVGNAAEHVTACVMAVKDKMDLAITVAVGSGVQIALLVTPALVILGWIIGQPMTMHFETFETIAFAFSVLVVTCTLQDGRSNYLEGAMLIGLYLIIALAFYAAPSDALGKVLAFWN